MSNDSTTKPIEWVEYPQAPPKAEGDGDGEPCPHCQKRLPRFEVRPTGSGLLVRVSCVLPAEALEPEMNGLCQLLQSFVYGLGGKRNGKSKAKRHRRKRKGV